MSMWLLIFAAWVGQHELRAQQTVPQNKLPPNIYQANCIFDESLAGKKINRPVRDACNDIKTELDKMWNNDRRLTFTGTWNFALNINDLTGKIEILVNGAKTQLFVVETDASTSRTHVLATRTVVPSAKDQKPVTFLVEHPTEAAERKRVINRIVTYVNTGKTP